jgi:flagellar secretion chaperone FliS
VSNPYENYKRMQVETSSQGRLLLMLYDGALKNLRQAKVSIDQRQPNQAHNCLIKAQDIVMELNWDLNMDAGDIAQRLRSLYLYIHKRLVLANVKKDPVIVQEAIGLLSELKEAWDTIILRAKSTATP